MILFFSKVEDMMPVLVDGNPKEITYVPSGLSHHVSELPREYFLSEYEEDEEDEEDDYDHISDAFNYSIRFKF